MRRYIADELIPTIQFPSTKRPGESTRRVLIAVALGSCRHRSLPMTPVELHLARCQPSLQPAVVTST